MTKHIVAGSIAVGLIASAVYLTVSLLARPGVPITAAHAAVTEVSVPGYVDFSVPLSRFAAPGLKEACQQLQKRVYARAHPQFAGYLATHPEDIAAAIGFMQSNIDDPRALLKACLADDQHSPTPANDVKVSLAALYVAGGETKVGTKETVKDVDGLSKLARARLLHVYDQTHAPVVGLLLIEVSTWVHVDPIATLEDMMRRIGDSRMNVAYDRAKHNGWNAPPPPINGVRSDNLPILDVIVGGLYGWKAATLMYQVNTYDKNRPNIVIKTTFKKRYLYKDARAAGAFFDAWKKEIDRGIKATSGHRTGKVAR